jgi:DNA-binding CsgD family transcriptional regulator
MNIKTITQTEQKWDIPEGLEQLLCKERIEKVLSSFSQVAGQRFYMLDYRKGKIMVDSSSSLILCGYSKELIEKEGFRFFKKILPQKELTWLSCANNAAYAVFFDTPLKNREKLVFSLDLACTTANNHDIILHHKIIPYQLCNNGNLWLSLCSTTVSYQKKSRKVSLINNQTGERYKLVHNKFERTTDFVLTEEEHKILGWLAKGFKVEHMALLMGVSAPTLGRKKWSLYKKIGVKTSAEAVHWAHIEGII